MTHAPHHVPTTLLRTLCVICMVAGTGIARAQQVAAPYDTPESLLSALADSDDRLNALETSLQYTRAFAIQGDTQTRRGSMRYDTAKPEQPGESPTRRFAIDFNERVIGERFTEDVQQFIFDGSWLVERLPAEKQFIKRQIVRPGERFDPFDAGGPMPLPIGRVRDDLLERFDATLPDPTENAPEDLAAFIQSKGHIQLRLVPKPAFEDAENYAEIRVWYRTYQTSDGDVILPEIAWAESFTGDTSLVLLITPKLNPELPDETFNTAPPPRGEGWEVRIEPWREATP